MESSGCYLHAAFLAATIFSWFPQAKADDVSLWSVNSTDWETTLQNKTKTSQHGNHTDLQTPEMAVVNTPNGPERVTPEPSPSPLSLAPGPGHSLDTPHPRDSSTPTTQRAESTGKTQEDIFKRDICEDGNNKMAMLVCLIIIAVLFLMCTLLFLSTVILANKVSSLKRSKQVCKRQTRSNGDFLATSGLWPAECDTGKRTEQLTGPRLMLQATGTLTASRERKDDGTTEKLTH